MENSKPKTGRPIKENSIGRVKYTTAIRASLLKEIQHYAIETGQTAADVLEIALLVYMDEKKRNR